VVTQRDTRDIVFSSSNFLPAEYLSSPAIEP